MHLKTTICIIGAGPAGLMAAIHAASAPTVVLEGKAAPGRKLLLTGGGRCNFTHAGGPEEIARAFGKAGRFLRHSLYEFSPDDVREFFRARGLPSTVEPDGCVFPAGNRATDVLDVLVREAQRLGSQLLCRSRVTAVAGHDGSFVIGVGDRQITAARLIIATGGLSWPGTGSKGDGYRFAAHFGHSIIPPKPALIPLITQEAWPGELAGVSLPNVRIEAATGPARPAVTGNMLFTQNGIGGPTVLDLSRLLVDELPDAVSIGIDVKPDINQTQLDHQLQQRLQNEPRRTIANILSEFVPRQFARVLCRLAACREDVPGGQLDARTRRRLVGLLKKLPLSVTGTEPMAKATVTHGGVRRDEIEPRTMESKIRPGLFFAGEVIDLDGPCGGYNLQMCWSTGALAGRAAAHSAL